MSVAEPMSARRFASSSGRESVERWRRGSSVSSDIGLDPGGFVEEVVLVREAFEEGDD